MLAECVLTLFSNLINKLLLLQIKKVYVCILKDFKWITIKRGEEILLAAADEKHWFDIVVFNNKKKSKILLADS